jgi:mitochondrial import inner membrane translocase subunit TIM21
LLGPRIPSRPLAVCSRFYATQNTTGSSSPSSKRRAVTPFNDDGHVPWTELSGGEKTARAAQQSFNFGMVIVGFVLTVRYSWNVSEHLLTIFQSGVVYFLYTEVFSPDSKVAYFNRAVDRIKKDTRCLELLGDSKRITAYGEPSWNKWRRARPIA